MSEENRVIEIVTGLITDMGSRMMSIAVRQKGKETKIERQCD